MFYLLLIIPLLSILFIIPCGVLLFYKLVPFGWNHWIWTWTCSAIYKTVPRLLSVLRSYCRSSFRYNHILVWWDIIFSVFHYFGSCKIIIKILFIISDSKNIVRWFEFLFQQILRIWFKLLFGQYDCVFHFFFFYYYK